MLKNFAKPEKMVGIVSDSYDIYNAVDHLWGEILHDQIVDSGAIIVIRPDSGNPKEVVLKTLEILDERFGHSINSKGFKVLNHVRVIQGDGVHEESIREILEAMHQANYSATNIAFGMGGALLQKMDRDTLKFAYKCSSITVDGMQRDVFKAPKTDLGKRSKKGKLDLIFNGATYQTISGFNEELSALRVVYENGEVLIEEDLETIRERALKK